MPVQYPKPLGARTARQEHNQILLCVPKSLVESWDLRKGDVVYWTQLDATHAMLARGAVPPPPTLADHPARKTNNESTVGP